MAVYDQTGLLLCLRRSPAPTDSLYELNLLKEASVDANKLWKAAGKPRSARFTIRARQVGEDIVSYFATNRCRKLSHTRTIYMMPYSRRMVMSFGSAGAPNLNNVRNVQRWKVVSTLTLLPKNLPIIFQKAYSCNNYCQANNLKHEYIRLRSNYSGFPLPDKSTFDTELVSKIISNFTTW